MVAKRWTAVPMVLVAIGSVCGWAATAEATRADGGQGNGSLPEFGPGESYRPVIDPTNFTAEVDNPLFPLPPGRTLVYSGTKDGKPALNVVAITPKAALIDGVTTRVVEDRLFLDGRLVERTQDYYAQDRAGNVWYFGEDTVALDKHGRVTSPGGSFRGGINGAQPGVFMQASPELGRRFRQEWSKGQAEDQFRAVSLAAAVRVPYGTFPDALRTEESTALEPRVLDNKYFVRGIGEVEELAVRGPRERLRLVDVIGP